MSDRHEVASLMAVWRRKMLIRAGVVWSAIMLIAILNGAARDELLVPRLGDLVARALSCLTLAALIVFVTWISIQWIHPASMTDAWTIGVMWLAMTLTFEFVAGHYLFRTEWPTLLADYNLLAEEGDCGFSCSSPRPSPLHSSSATEAQ